jgi:hypothetical protein
MIVMVLLAGSVSAQVFKPVDSRRLADVNKKVIQPDQLDLKTLPRQLYQTGEAPAARKRVARKSANTRMANVSMVDLPLHPVGFVPQKNFTAKHATQSDQKAVLPDGRPAAEVLPAETAPIRKRVIHARTPAGEQKLREQLRKLQVPQEKQ